MNISSNNLFIELQRDLDKAVKELDTMQKYCDSLDTAIAAVQKNDLMKSHVVVREHRIAAFFKRLFLLRER